MSKQNKETKDNEQLQQLLRDFPFWRSRVYYIERLRKFLAYELTAVQLVNEVLYPILSDKREGTELAEDFKFHTKIELDPKSFGFSNILFALSRILEGFDEDPEATAFTEKELHEIVKNVLTDLEKYPIE